jgi:RNase adaptor protein for sRNA GlmZ degradation
MAVEESFEPGLRLGTWRPVYRVAGDPRRFRTFPSREAAEKVEAELAGAVTIVSFGHLHGEPPAADVVVDLRPFRDPHAAATLRHLTADDQPVRTAVLGTPGIPELIRDTAASVSRLADAGAVTVAVGCQGGRHRAPTVAREIADRLTAAGHTVVVQHRDMGKPVVRR